VASFLSACLAVAAIIAQAPVTVARPDFSGTWRLDIPQRDSSQFEAVFLIIQQTERDITIEWSRGASKRQSSYRFTTEAPRTLNVNAGPRQAYWKGSALVTEGASVINGQTVTVRETRTLNAAGTEMTVDSILMVQHGYASRLQSATSYGSGRDVYVRVVR
jgi:hypothetical protein